MTDTNIDETEPVTAPAAPTADEQPKEEGRLEHAKSSVIHVVESVVDKVTDTLGGHKGDDGQH
jgi:hypothetical protein